MADAEPVASDSDAVPPPARYWALSAEDAWAMWLAAGLLALGALGVASRGLWDPEGPRQPLAWIAPKLDKWTDNPVHCLWRAGSADVKSYNHIPSVLALGALTMGLLSVAAAFTAGGAARFAGAFAGLFALALFADALAKQRVVNHYNLETPLLAIVTGMMIANSVGPPRWLRPALRAELYIKTGLVLLGAEVLFGRLLELGLPGVFISWVTTPIVFIGTYLFGQYVLRVQSRSLNMTLSADMSVCGVSAAIATAAACKATKEELSLAIGISLAFTAVMMVAMPAAILAMGLDPVLGGAWIGGTIDATGAVAAAGAALGEAGFIVATTVKMIQNILIGVIAFGVAVYWVTFIERDAGIRPSPWEIWRRFPKFVLGFMAASLFFSWLHARGADGSEWTNAITRDFTVNIRNWFFALGFVSIGLETDFRALRHHLKGGKPLTLYIVGQAFNLILTLFMAWFVFTILFPETHASLLAGSKE